MEHVTHRLSLPTPPPWQARVSNCVAEHAVHVWHCRSSVPAQPRVSYWDEVHDVHVAPRVSYVMETGPFVSDVGVYAVGVWNL